MSSPKLDANIINISLLAIIIMTACSKKNPWEPDDLSDLLPGPTDPDTYLAETPEQEGYYIGLDANGYQVWSTDYVYGASSKKLYRITFPRIGGPALLEEVYKPFEVININNEQNYTQAELSTMMSRTEFPISANTIEPTDMTFYLDPIDYGYFEWPKEDGSCCYRGNVIIGEQKVEGTTFYIESKRPTAAMNQTYIIVDPVYPQFGGRVGK